MFIYLFILFPFFSFLLQGYHLRALYLTYTFFTLPHASSLTSILFAQFPGPVFHVPFWAASQGSSCRALVNMPFFSVTTLAFLPLLFIFFLQLLLHSIFSELL